MNLGSALRLVSWAFAALFVLFAFAEPVDAETVRVGVLEDQRPYYQKRRETGDPSGYAIDIMNRIAAQADIDVVFQTFADPNQLLMAVERGNIDVVPLLPETRRARELLSFVGTLGKARLSLFTRKDNPNVNSKKDLLGRRVSFVTHGIAVRTMREFRGELSIPHTTVDDVLSALVAGTSDAAILQYEVGFNHARALGVASLLRVSSEAMAWVDLGVGVSAARPDLAERLRAATQKYRTSKSFHHDRTTWIANPPATFDLRSVLMAAGGLLLATIFGFALWRYVSVLQLNKALDRAVRETQDAENRFRDFAEAAADWFFETDAQHRITYYSPKYADVVKLSDHEIIGQTLHDVHARQRVQGDDAKWRALGQSIERQQDWQDISLDLIVEDTTRHTISMSGRAVRDDAGAFVGYRGVARDITERVNTERALRQSQKMETVGQMTGGIAHDFNNLLTVLIGNIELLRRRVAGDQIAARYVETASSATTLGAELTKRLLAFSRQQTLDPKLVELDSSVLGFVPLIERTLGNDITIETDLNATGVFVRVDESQFQNVLLNLVINARDAMPSGGALRIESMVFAENGAPASPHTEAGKGDVLRLTISDTGIGIPENDLEKIVEPFFTTKDVGKGTGMGLSMAYSFAQQSEGCMTIESAQGKGTSVQVNLPVAQGGQTSPASLETTEAFPKGTETVLVVDDEAGIRDVTARRLESLGYAVLEAEDGPSALDELGRTVMGADIDILLTDVTMPHGLSGIELAAQARKLKPDVKVLFASGHTNENVEEVDKENWLQKPYTMSDLACKVREVLDR